MGFWLAVDHQRQTFTLLYCHRHSECHKNSKWLHPTRCCLCGTPGRHSKHPQGWMRNDDPINSHTQINIRNKNNNKKKKIKESLLKNNLHSNAANGNYLFCTVRSTRLTTGHPSLKSFVCTTLPGWAGVIYGVSHRVTTQQTLTKKRIQWAMNVSQVKYSKLATSIGNTAIQHMLLSWSQHPGKLTILTCQKHSLTKRSMIFVLLMLSFTPEPLKV